MKKIGDIMSEMGFRKDAPDSVKESFLRHLMKSAAKTDFQTSSEQNNPVKTEKNLRSKLRKPVKSLREPEQLSFEFYKEKTKKIS